jgi:hypothetical protein
MPANWLSVPHYEQEFHYSCTPACVRMVLQHVGCSRTEDELRQLLQTNSQGTVARNIMAVQSLGFDVHVGTATMPQLEAAIAGGIPPIVYLLTDSLDYWNTSCFHVAVFVGLDTGVVYLNDPFFKESPLSASSSGGHTSQTPPQN